jgi:hypothetical protein
MILLGAHRINKGQFDVGICNQIISSNGLTAGGGSTFFGTGAYAYYLDTIPARFRGDSFVIFQAAYDGRGRLEARDIRVLGAYTAPDRQFFVLPASPGSTVAVAILGFINCPGFPTYPGTLLYT